MAEGRMLKTADRVEDEHTHLWDVLSEADGILQREDSQRYYGAVWVPDRDGTGEVCYRRDGDTVDGLDTVWTFTEMGGWCASD